MTRASKPGGAPELAAICNKLNHLAATLGEAVEDKRRLAERAVSLQDVERKEIARELHDEFGPYLFALRAHASALTRLADAAEPNAEAARKHGSAMLEQINALQQFNRRVLEKLRPVGLARARPSRGARRAAAAMAGVASRCRDRNHDLAGARRDRRDRRSDHLPHRAGGADQRVPPRRRDLRQCQH